MTLDKQLVIVMGVPRSGTSWLQAMIGAHPLVCTTVELALFDGYIAPWIETWQKAATSIENGQFVGLPFLWSEGEFYGFLREFLRKVYLRVSDTNPLATHILEKHPEYTQHVETIDNLIPHALFIHLIRDGRDVAASLLAAKEELGFGADSIQDAARQWKRGIRAGCKARMYRERYLEIRYEDLLTDGVGTLTAVFDFCRLPVNEGQVAAIVGAHQFENMKRTKQSADRRAEAPDAHYRKGKQGSWREDLEPVERYLFDRYAGGLMRELGYAEGHWWADSRLQRVVLPVSAYGMRYGLRVPFYAVRYLSQRVTVLVRTRFEKHHRAWKKTLHFSPIVRRERAELVRARHRYESLYVDPEDKPLVSIVILTYNRAELLVERAIRSALAQTYQNLEILVIGDHCTDDTAERLRQVNDPRVRFHNLQKRGPYPDDPRDFWRVAGVYARNKATELVHGKWIAPLDDDTMFTPDHVEALLHRAQRERLELVMSKAKAEKRPGQWVVEGVSLAAFGRGAPFASAPCVSLFRTYLYSVFPADMSTLKTDWPADAHLYWRMHKAGVRAGFVDEVLLVSPLRPGISASGWRAEDVSVG